MDIDAVFDRADRGCGRAKIRRTAAGGDGIVDAGGGARGVGYPALVVPLVLAGVGVSMAVPAAQNAVLSSVAVTEMGKASGVFNMGRFLGGMFGIALLVAVFSATGAVDSPAHFSTGFAAAMMVATVLSLSGALVGLWLPARRPVIAAPTPDTANDRLSLSTD